MEIIIRFIRRRKIAIAAALVIATTMAYAFWPKNVPLEHQFVTAAVEKGNLVQMVSANGTLNPVVLVNVGTQVSGVVKKIYADFNDQVDQGEVLLELDPSLVQAQLNQSEANIANAKATLTFAQANEKRIRQLFKQDYVARQDLDQAVQSLKTAKAQLDLAQAQATRDRVNLGYTVIRSPVSGVIVSREVDVGQTVAASFQTPTLFRIAQDLTHMQINSSFAEADIGGIREGQEAKFAVDAYPNREFSGLVRQVRLNPTTLQNVVTYNVVIDVNNDEGILLPGMTAYVSVVVARLNDVIKVPNSGLRFRPEATATIEKNDKEPAHKTTGTQGTVYLLGGRGLRPVHLVLGASDGTSTEVIDGNLHPGDAVVIDNAQPGAPEKRSASIRIR